MEFLVFLVSDLYRGFHLTFGQRVPAGPVGDPLIKEVSTVPTLVHPAMSIWVGPRQLTLHTQMQMLLMMFTIIRQWWYQMSITLPSGKNLKSATHVSENFVIWSCCIGGPPSDAGVSRLVKWVIGHYSSSMEVGRQDEIVVLHPLYDGQSLWFNLWKIFKYF